MSSRWARRFGVLPFGEVAEVITEAGNETVRALEVRQLGREDPFRFG